MMINKNVILQALNTPLFIKLHAGVSSSRTLSSPSSRQQLEMEVLACSSPIQWRSLLEQHMEALQRAISSLPSVQGRERRAA